MEAFTSLTAVAVPVDLPNVDTDQIIPARFLGRAREEQAPAMFHDMRRASDGSLRHDFPLNQDGFAGAGIIVAGRNFACGSSRENAVTVMVDNGFRAFVAPSFGDIFFNNCFQNGALPIMLPEARVAELRAALHAKPGANITVDLVSQTVTGPDGKIDHFEIDSFRKDCLLRGIDSVTLTLSHASEIAAFEARQKEEVSWL
ncbi:MAG: 3-isopropylmalate dehydratase small subunit [Alphaproteobacteria bacterium]|jgi:3-isopropylmalate/(R)-2-methylmalate dehydratase small subunit